jgi:hypothetical protein
LVNRCDPSDPIIKEVMEAVESGRIAPEQILRDCFAAAAMQSLIVTNSETNTIKQIAETAYLLADAMIRERERAIGVLQAALDQPEEPVAMRYDYDGYGYQYIDSGSGSDWRTRHQGAEPLYTNPISKGFP